MSQTRNQNLNTVESEFFEKIFKILGTCVGAPLAIYSAVKVTKEDLVSIPFVSTELAQTLPLDLNRLLIFLFVLGTVLNSYDKFGKSLDYFRSDIKSFPSSPTLEEIKKWMFSLDMAKSSHIVGTTFGTALYGVYLSQSIKESDSFALPFSMQKYMPFWLVQVLALIFIAGACSNLISYCTVGVKQVADTTKLSVPKVTNYVSSFFKKPQEGTTAANNNNTTSITNSPSNTPPHSP